MRKQPSKGRLITVLPDNIRHVADSPAYFALQPRSASDERQRTSAQKSPVRSGRENQPGAHMLPQETKAKRDGARVHPGGAKPCLLKPTASPCAFPYTGSPSAQITGATASRVTRESCGAPARAEQRSLRYRIFERPRRKALTGKQARALVIAPPYTCLCLPVAVSTLRAGVMLMLLGVPPQGDKGRTSAG
ncbi:unnamed protein product [Rangifer tarandus platyrhynchus]|uniref:Uncharacterized protein n=1 Tax=Rangifer tarandus platyrhynchus TaxID=3082113 RepID=A0ABN8XJ82_RANTA|nr:unnamed protein product [Rangifer tarandus platyrhynchus]